MDTTTFYFIILMVAILVIITIGMYHQLSLANKASADLPQAMAYIRDMERLNDSNDKQIAKLEKELEDMYQCHASGSNPWELADTLQERWTAKIDEVWALEDQLELSQTARKLQAKQIKELQDEICKLEYKLQDFLAMAHS